MMRYWSRMLVDMRLITHLSALAVAVTVVALAASEARPTAQAGTPPQAADTTTATYSVLVRGARVGSETVTTTRTDDGLSIRATGRLAPPIDIITNRFELDYGPGWQARRLAVEGTFRSQLFTLSTTFGPNGAASDLLQGGQRATNTQVVAPDAIVLPNNFFAAYTALAARLAPLGAGATVPVYIAPEAAATATIDRVTPRRIATPERTFDIREFALTLSLPGGPTPVNIWVDGDGGLARVSLPSSSVVALREDFSSVLTREEFINNPTDESVFIPAAGFSLGATVTPPPGGANGNVRPIILVAGRGEADRERTLHGVPIYGQLAGALADAGFYVVRYDRRGLGQSGGRIESATLEDLADDVRSIVTWLRRQDGIDDERIAVIGHGEAAAVALIAARRESRIKAVGLIGAHAGTGRDVTLAQQARELAALEATGTIDAAERQRREALQRTILEAVLTGEGWDAVPPALRRQADSPLFASWLRFDPAGFIEDVDEPLLILRGALDREATETDADRLEQLSAARERAIMFTRRVTLPGLNHLLVPAETGGIVEYATLAETTIAQDVAAAIVAWLNQVMPSRP